MKRVICVGAGPASLFAAMEIAGKYDVTVLEESEHVGGSGLYSDGKLNFHPQIGGDLSEFLELSDAWGVIDQVRGVFSNLGVETAKDNDKGQASLETKAAKAGIRFIKINQSHIGSDRLPVVMSDMRKRLEEKGVAFKLQSKVNNINNSGGKVIVETSKDTYECDAVLLAPGRKGSRWLAEICEKLGISMSHNPIDVGVRVEVPNEVFDEIINDLKIWDPKFHIYTKSYDDFTRTFCVCPGGFVVKEHYEDGLFGVNGHSMSEITSPNTNFSLITTVKLTHPIENSTEYGRRVAQLTNTLGGHMPILQRLGDLVSHRRSTWDRIKRSYVQPTLTEVTPGDISMAYPSRIIADILESLEALDRVIPGINSSSTLLYAPEIKFYSMRIQTNKELQTKEPNIFVAGDGAGLSRGIVGAAATGIIAAYGILRQLKTSESKS